MHRRYVALLVLVCGLVCPRLLAQELPAGAVARLGTDRYRALPAYPTTVLSPDGKRLVVLPDQGEPGLYDVATWKRLPLLGRKEIRANGGTFSADGKELAIADAGRRQIQVWDVATGRQLRKLTLATPDNQGVQSLFFAAGVPLAVELLRQEEDNEGRLHLVVWDYAKAVQRQKIICPNQNIQNTEIAIAPDGKLLALALRRDEDGREVAAQLWDLVTGKERGKIALDGNPERLLFSPDGRLLLASGFGTHQLFRMPGGDLVQHLRLRGSNGQLARFSPDSKALLLGDPFGNVQEWDLATSKLIRTYPAPLPSEAIDVAGHAGGTIVLARRGLALIPWELRTGKTFAPLDGPCHEISDLRFQPDGTLLCADTGCGLTVWDPRTGSARRSYPLENHGELQNGAYALPPLAGDASDMRISAGGEFAFASGSGDSLGVHDLRTGKLLYGENLRGGDRLPFALCDEGRQVAAALGKRLHLWQAATGRNLAVLPLPLSDKEQVFALAAAPDGTSFALQKGERNMEGRRLVVWRPKTRTTLRTFDLSEDIDTALTYRADGRLLAVGLEGKLVLVRTDQEGGDQVVTIQPGGQGFSELAFSPDGRQLAVASQPSEEGATATLWIMEMASRKVRLKLPGHAQGTIRRLAFAADGSRLASGGSDTSVLLWHTGVRPLAAAPKTLADDELEKLWTRLAGSDAADAFQAQRALASDPAGAVALLARHLPPAGPADTGGRTIAAWISDLSQDRYATRARASQMLEKLGPAAAPALQQALQQAPPLEMKRRLEELLGKINNPTLAGPELAQVRALEVLEAINTGEACAHLTRLATGEPTALLTREATAALRRGATEEKRVATDLHR